MLIRENRIFILSDVENMILFYYLDDILCHSIMKRLIFPFNPDMIRRSILGSKENFWTFPRNAPYYLPYLLAR